MDDQGGFLIPEVAYIDEKRKGFIFSLIRSIGWYIMCVGSFIRCIGYQKKKIYPRKALIESLQKDFLDPLTANG